MATSSLRKRKQLLKRRRQIITIIRMANMITVTDRIRIAVLLLACQAIFACGQSPDGHHDHGGEGAHADHGDHNDDPALIYTDFTGQTELFVEFPPLVAGKTSVFAAHVTRLSDFKPLHEGTLDVILARDEKTVARFHVKEPARSGIFMPSVVPREPGKFSLLVNVKSGDIDVIHRLGAVEVFADSASIVMREGGDEGEITYLKEQQWTSPFAVTVASEKLLRASVSGAASVYASESAETGGLVAYMQNRSGREEDYGETLIALERARGEAELARQEVRRLESLYQTGAVPEKLLLEARKVRDVADVALNVAKARIQHHAAASGNTTDARRWLHIRVPEFSAGRLQQVSGAWFKQGHAIRVLDIDHGVRIVKVGGAVDPVSRTVPVVLEYPADQGPSLIGASLTAHVYTHAPELKLAIPVSAVIDDGGRNVVYVQTGGESFTRRAVELGIQDGSWVEVSSGVYAGERVVSEGAYYVKLAASGGDEIGHGHAH